MRSQLLKCINVHLLIAVVVASPFSIIGFSNNALAQIVTITTSADSHGRVFFGEGTLQVVVTDPDADDDDVQEDITVDIDADPDIGTGASGSFTVFETSQSSGRFEFYLLHASSALAAASIDAINTNGAADHPVSGIPPLAEASVIEFGTVTGSDLVFTNALFEDVNFDITVGDDEITVDYEESSSTLELDRSTYGSDSLVYFIIIDQDANKNPTERDEFSATASELNTLLFDIQGASFDDDVTFEETGDNTARFEGTVTLSGAASSADDELIFTSEAIEVTLNDVAEYNPPADVTGSTDTSSRSFDIDDVDGELDEIAALKFSSELKLTLNDNDRNRDSDDDETLDDVVTVNVDAAGGDSETLDMEETDDNTGQFIIDLSNNELRVTFLVDSASPTLNNSILELRQPDITEDLVIAYNDARDDDSTNSITSSQTVDMTLAIGSLDLPDAAGLNDNFIMTLTDGDLNDNPRTIDSYTFTFTDAVGSPPYDLKRGGDPIGLLANLEVEIEGEIVDFGIDLDYTLVETDVNSGVFTVELSMADILSSSGVDVDDGDELEITFNDLMGDVVSESSDTLLIEIPLPSPSEGIANLIDRAGDLSIRPGSLTHAAKLLSDDNPKNDKGVCGKLNAFINRLNSQAGKKLAFEDAEELKDRASGILGQIGC